METIKPETLRPELSFMFLGRGSYVFVEIGGKWREVKKNADTVKQCWRVLFGKGKPVPNKKYKMRLDDGFKLTECNDADCPLSGCKHYSCYWADYGTKPEKQYF